MGLADWVSSSSSPALRSWDKWSSSSVGSSPDKPLTAALLLNYDPSAPSRALPIIAEQRGTSLAPADLAPFVEAVRRNELQKELFFIGQNQYLVTAIQEQWFCARCVNSETAGGGGGAIAMQAASFLLVALYDGSLAAASRAMAAVDRFASSLSRRNL